MRKSWIAVVLIAAILAGAMLLMARLNRSHWTTESEAALSEFEQGLDAEMKYYGADAREHYEKAVLLDPNFVVAKLSLLEREYDKQRRAKLYTEVSQAPLDNLSDRERFIVQYRLAEMDHRPDEAERVITEYLTEHPKDSFALGYRCTEAWEAGDLDTAEILYKQLLKVDPNWVMAQNHLGYIAMARGRFAEAEELFNTYKYVAPDQANPHDSLGELLTLLGRYDEAKYELHEALRVKPDFCASYNHLLGAAVLEGDFDAAKAFLDAGQQECGELISNFSRCNLVLWQALLTGSYESAWLDENAVCVEQLAQESFLVHRLAILTGRMDQAREIESIMGERTKRVSASAGARSKWRLGLLQHLEGVRLTTESEPTAALEKLQSADDNLQYWGQGQGLLKLFNRLHIAVVLGELGQANEAQNMLEEIAKVNPRITEFHNAIRDSLTNLVN